MSKKLDSDIIDTIVKSLPNIYKTIKYGQILYEFAVRRKKKGLIVDVKYIKWLNKQVKKQQITFKGKILSLPL